MADIDSPARGLLTREMWIIMDVECRICYECEKVRRPFCIHTIELRFLVTTNKEHEVEEYPWVNTIYRFGVQLPEDMPLNEATAQCKEFVEKELNAKAVAHDDWLDITCGYMIFYHGFLESYENNVIKL